MDALSVELRNVTCSHGLFFSRKGLPSYHVPIWQPCARDSGNKTAASVHGMGSGGLAVDAMAIGCLGVERRGERFFGFFFPKKLLLFLLVFFWYVWTGHDLRPQLYYPPEKVMGRSARRGGWRERLARAKDCSTARGWYRRPRRLSQRCCGGAARLHLTLAPMGSGGPTRDPRLSECTRAARVCRGRR